MGRNTDMKTETKTGGRNKDTETEEGGRQRELEAEERMCSLALARRRKRRKAHTFEVCLSHLLSSAENR